MLTQINSSVGVTQAVDHFGDSTPGRGTVNRKMVPLAAEILRSELNQDLPDLDLVDERLRSAAIHPATRLRRLDRTDESEGARLRDRSAGT